MDRAHPSPSGRSRTRIDLSNETAPVRGKRTRPATSHLATVFLVLLMAVPLGTGASALGLSTAPSLAAVPSHGGASSSALGPAFGALTQTSGLRSASSTTAHLSSTTSPTSSAACSSNCVSITVHPSTGASASHGASAPSQGKPLTSTPSRPFGTAATQGTPSYPVSSPSVRSIQSLPFAVGSLSPPVSEVVAYAPVTITAGPDGPLAAGTQVLLNVSWASYAPYVAPSVSNVVFFDSSGNALNAWMESGAGSTSQGSNVWLRLGSSIPASTASTLYLGFLPTGTSTLSPAGPWGEAPQLSSLYAQYDDGAAVFAAYFDGNAPASDFSVGSGMTVTSGALFPYGTRSIDTILEQSAGVDGPMVFTGVTLPIAGYTVESQFANSDPGTNTGVAGICDAPTSAAVQYGFSTGTGLFGDYLNVLVLQSGTLGYYNTTGTGNTNWNWAQAVQMSASANAFRATLGPNVDSNVGAYVATSPSVVILSGATSLYLCTINAGAAGYPTAINFNWMFARLTPPSNDSVGVKLGAATYLGAPAPTASPNPVDEGSTITLSDAPAGGTTPYTFNWQAPAAWSCQVSSTATRSRDVCGVPGTFTTGTYPVWVNVTDALGFTTHSPWTNVTVYPKLLAPAPTGLPNPVDAGSNLQLTAAASGGTGSYVYAWNLSPEWSCAGPGAISVCAIPSGFPAGTYPVAYNVTDTSGATVGSAVLTVTVNPALAYTLSTSPDPTDSGIAVVFSLTPSGGTAPYSFAWRFDDGSPTSFAQSPQHAFNVTGATVFTVGYWLNDSTGVGLSGSVPVTVNPTLVNLIQPFTSPTDSGSPTVFSSRYTGGTGPYTFAWSFGDGSAVSGYPSPTHVYNVTVTTVFTVSSWVNDSLGESAKAIAHITVDPALAAPIPTASPNPADPGNTVVVQESPTGGQGPGSYSWPATLMSGPAGFSCSGTQTTTTVTLSCAFPPTQTPGVYAIAFLVSDGIQTLWSPRVHFTLLSPLKPTAVVPSASAVSQGGQVTFSGSVSGGLAPYAFSWHTPAAWACTATSSQGNSTDSCAVPASFPVGSWGVWYNVTDSVPYTASSPVLLFGVVAAGSLVVSTPVPSQNPTDAGRAVTFQASASGGVGPYVFHWVNNPQFTCSNSTSGASSTEVCAIASGTGAGSYPVQVTAEDSTYAKVSASAFEYVYPQLLSNSPSSTFSPVDAGTWDNFTSGVLGGDTASAYTFSWHTPAGWSCTVVAVGVQSGDDCLIPSAFPAGIWPVWVNASDVLGTKVQGAAYDLTVGPALGILYSAGGQASDGGVPVDFLAWWAGGIGAYHFAWRFGDGGSSASENTTYAYGRVPQVTTYWVRVWVNDSGDGFATAVFPVVIAPDPNVRVYASHPVVDVGQSVTFTAWIGNGTAPYSLEWIGLPAGCTSTNTTTLTCAPTAPGSYSVGVWLVDHVGVVATMPSNWNAEAAAGSSPGALAGGAMSWDAADGNAVLFGGEGCSGLGDYYCANANTSVFQGGVWTTILRETGVDLATFNSTCVWTSNGSATVCPLQRFDASMAYDAADGYLLMFGGVVSAPPNVCYNCERVAADTWAFGGGVWRELFPAVRPPPLEGASMVYDPALHEVILFGGSAQTLDSRSFSGVSDTWAFSGGQWTELEYQTGFGTCFDIATSSSVSCPTPRFLAGMSYDPGTSSIVLFGGDNCDQGCPLSDTWEFTSAGMWVSTPSGPMPPLADPTMVYDALDGYTLLYGGDFSGAEANACPCSISPYSFAFLNGTWTQLPTPRAPLGGNGWGRVGAQATYWPGHGVLLYGGVGSWWNPGYFTGLVPSSDTWVYAGTGAPITVYPIPSVNLAASRHALDVGQTTTLVATTSGGAPPPTLAWTGTAAAGCTPVNAVKETCAPTTAGSFTVTFTLTDATGAVASASVVLTVSPALGTPTLTAVPSMLDLGQTTALTTSIAGGTGVYTYTWSGLPPGCSGSSTSSLSCAPTATGTFAIAVTVSDSNGELQTSSSLSIQVVSALGTPTVTASRAALDVGQTVTFTGLVAGGTGSYTYAWTGLPTGCFSVNAASLTCTPTASGSLNVVLNVKDSNGASSSSAGTAIVVSNDPAVTSLVGAPSVLDLGQGTTLSATASPGAGTPTYTWTGLPPGCTSTSALTLTCTPGATGTFSVTLWVMDANGFNAISVPLTLVVDPALVASASANPTTAVVGTSVAFSSSVQGGTAPVTYHWAFGDGTSSTSFAPAHVYSAPGTYTVWLNVTDAAGEVASAQVPVLVSAPPVVPPLTPPQLAVSSTQVEEGTPLFLSVSESGGLEPYTYAWSGLPGGCVAANLPALSCTPSATGTFRVSVLLTDAAGGRATSNNVSVDVAAALEVSLSTNRTAVPQGTVVAMQARETGGFGPYSYTWYLNGTPTVGNGAWLNLTLAHAGTYLFTVEVTDAQGRTATSQVVQVTASYERWQMAAPPPAGGPSALELAQLGLSAAIFVIAVLALLLLYVRSRRRGGARPTAAPVREEEAPAPPPPPPRASATVAPAAEEGSADQVSEAKAEYSEDVPDEPES